MKKIPHVDLPGAQVLTPLQMNAIHFDTGEHSNFVADTIDTATTGGTSDPIKKPIQH